METTPITDCLAKLGVSAHELVEAMENAASTSAKTTSALFVLASASPIPDPSNAKLSDEAYSYQMFLYSVKATAFYYTALAEAVEKELSINRFRDGGEKHLQGLAVKALAGKLTPSGEGNVE